MTSSLIPERPLLISPTLAATIGLEEAVLLHVLSELLLRHPTERRQDRDFVCLDSADLQAALPFWTPEQIQRVQQSLQQLGLLLVERAPEDGRCWLAINQGSAPRVGGRERRGAAALPVQGRSNGRAQPLPGNWVPEPAVYQQCAQRNVPREFVDRCLSPFLIYHRERGSTQYSWQRAFLNWVIADWEKQRAQQNARVLESSMGPDWQPSEEAVSILEHGGISQGFIEAAVPEFVLYWREKGTVGSEWNSRFIAHVRRQWEGYRHALEQDSTPRPIPPDFQPDPACYDVLAMANIDTTFAEAQLPEFLLYWLDRKEAQRSWNTKFLQHVKFKWAQRSQDGVNLLARLTDRSWAD